MARAAQRGRAADYARGRIPNFRHQRLCRTMGCHPGLLARSRGGVLDAADIERSATDFARFPNSGVIVAVGSQVLIHRGLIISLAARHRWPTVSPLGSGPPPIA